MKQNLGGGGGGYFLPEDEMAVFILEITGKVVCDAGGSWVYFQVKLCVMQGVAGCTSRSSSV